MVNVGEGVSVGVLVLVAVAVLVIVGVAVLNTPPRLLFIASHPSKASKKRTLIVITTLFIAPTSIYTNQPTSRPTD